MSPPTDDHDCGWKAYAAAQTQALAEVRAQLEALKRQVYARRSEKRAPRAKLPPPIPPVPADPDQIPNRGS